MTNLLRRCENCVNAITKYVEVNEYRCEPKVPYWISKLFIPTDVKDRLNFVVRNDAAERCPAFRLREIGENRNV